MAVTNPNSIRFINEVVRPLCEKARAFNVLVNNASVEWFAGVNSTVDNDAEEAIDDGREAQGVSRLTGADVNSVMAIVIAMKNASNSEIVSKPCVRALTVE